MGRRSQPRGSTKGTLSTKSACPVRFVCRSHSVCVRHGLPHDVQVRFRTCTRSHNHREPVAKLAMGIRRQFGLSVLRSKPAQVGACMHEQSVFALDMAHTVFKQQETARTGSVDSSNCVCPDSSPCSCASFTDLSCSPHWPHTSDKADIVNESMQCRTPKCSCRGSGHSRVVIFCMQHDV